MPNWCSNHVTISHTDPEMIDVIVQELEKENAELFQSILPRPEEYSQGDLWYGWNCENWGTKWDAQIGDWSREDDNTVVIDFDTAWSPSTPIYRHLYEEGYEVKAFYIEEGMAYCGKFDDGEDYYYQYGDGDEIDEEVDSFWGISERREEEEQEEKYNDWIESCKELETTDWYPVKVNPVTKGVYETKSDAWPYPNKSYWDGEQWCFYNFQDDCGTAKLMNLPTEWRGITEEAVINQLAKDLADIAGDE